MKLTFIKFLVGGLAVMLSYIISVMLPWKELGGVLQHYLQYFLFLYLLLVCNMEMSLPNMLVEVQFWYDRCIM